MDGADQSAHDLPKVLGRIPKDLSPWPQKLQAVILHGVPKREVKCLICQSFNARMQLYTVC